MNAALPRGAAFTAANRDDSCKTVRIRVGVPAFAALPRGAAFTAAFTPTPPDSPTH
jgi:hypothetical protein